MLLKSYWSKIALLVLISATAGVTGAVIQQKFSEPKVVVQKVEKPKPVVQPKKEPPKTEAPKPKPKEDPPKKQIVQKRQVKKHEDENAEPNTKPEPQRKSTGPSHQELKAFWNRMYELNDMLYNNIENDGFFAQYEISWIKEVRNQLHSMKVPDDSQAVKYHRTFTERMDLVWFWIFDGEDDVQAQRVLDDWGYESQLLFADEYQSPSD